MMRAALATGRRRRLPRLRPLSDAAVRPAGAAAAKEADADASSSSAPPSSAPPPSARIPTRHSARRLPPVCTDAQALRDLTRDLIGAPPGALYTYRAGRDAGADAWAAADAAVQRAEFVLRGHARRLPGTTWHRWLSGKENAAAAATAGGGTSSDQVAEALDAMQRVLDRLAAEGLDYMRLRASRLEEVQGPRVNAHMVPSDDPAIATESVAGPSPTSLAHAREVFDGVKAAAGRGDGAPAADVSSSSSNSDSESDPGESESSSDDSDDSDDPTYMEDFAPPGPTTAMYDTLLDAMACHAATAPDLVTAPGAYFLLEDAVARHKLDGGDDGNASVFTRPTAQTFNAAIRVAAALPYDAADGRPANQRRRDDALHLAFAAYDLLAGSCNTAVARNGATYTYLLQVVAKYFPPSRSRGHIARGMLLHARAQGLLDGPLLRAYAAANEPTNGAEFEETLALVGKPASDLPHKWRARNRALRHHPREATY